MQSQANLVNMEAAMYGFGGHYKEDKQEKASNVVSLATKDGVKQLQRFGF
jgi:hypothetical protein